MNIREYIKNNLLDFLGENKILNKLSKDNRFTYPKVPTKNVFLNPPLTDIKSLSLIRKEADHYFENDRFTELPLEDIDIYQIVPTQINLTIPNLKSTFNNNNNTGAFLVKHDNLYYILDGHHRIANKILQGNTIVSAYVHIS